MVLLSIWVKFGLRRYVARLIWVLCRYGLIFDMGQSRYGFQIIDMGLSLI